ncbi:MAG: family 43 glycosylhydrolase, partial [Clostridia bacterium]|nr:family 43 glycosylhydrolase [Clostridia bacterium]
MIITDMTKIGDPQVVLYEGKYYCYATNCDHYSTGFCVWVSDDLEHWSEAIPCFDAISYWGKSHFWAPEVVYHNGKFIMHYTAMSRELNSLRLGVAISDSPTGPFVDALGKPMFDLGYATIDGSVLIDETGNYFYYSRDCSENFVNDIRTSQIYCVKLSDDLTTPIGEHVLVTTPTLDFETVSLNMDPPHLWNEGPCVMKVGDKYVMNYSANCYATNDYA